MISEEEKVNNIERITVEERHKLDTFVNSPRYNHIQKIKKSAMKHKQCKEQLDNKCMYLHCGCLF